MTTDIDWPARRERAKQHLDKLKAAWAEAREKRRPVLWIVYDYRDEPPAARGRDEERDQHNAV